MYIIIALMLKNYLLYPKQNNKVYNKIERLPLKYLMENDIFSKISAGIL
jgi:hypothetical protein